MNDNSPIKDFGSIIRENRNRKRMSQGQLGELIYVSKSQVSKWENNKSQPDNELLKKIAETLEFPYETFFGIPEKKIAAEGRLSSGISIFYRPIVYSWKPYRTSVLFLTIVFGILQMFVKERVVNSLFIIVFFLYIAMEFFQFLIEIRQPRTQYSCSKDYAFFLYHHDDPKKLIYRKKTYITLIFYNSILSVLSFAFIVGMMRDIMDSETSIILAIWLLFTLTWEVYLMVSISSKGFFNSKIMYSESHTYFSIWRIRLMAILNGFIFFFFSFASYLYFDVTFDSFDKIILIIVVALNFLISILLVRIAIYQSSQFHLSHDIT